MATKNPEPPIENRFHHHPIKEELAHRHIPYDQFNSIYQPLKAEGRLYPLDLASQGITSRDMYYAIIQYLTDQGVLTEKHEVRPEVLRLFDAKLTLEKRLEAILKLPQFPLPPEQQYKNSGGIVECREERREGGGYAPCRY
jgi:hypothetical protein